MHLIQHPEYEKYLRNQKQETDFQGMMTPWLAEDSVEAQAWVTAVSQLSAMFQEYNQVMWQAFPFCHNCLGGCCVVGAFAMTVIDEAALGALHLDIPVLPAQTYHTYRACIYLGAQGCTWPAAWRPLKCMIFYSLGFSGWTLASSGEKYDELKAALQAVLDHHLPAILGNDLPLLTGSLADPIQYAVALTALLTDRFLPAAWSK